MSDFKNKSITTKGLELLSKAMAGGKLEFTRIEMGSGTFSGDISNVENLVEVKQNLAITNIIRKGGQVTLSAILKIEDITTEYDWSEIGVYAKGADDVEVLYMYGYTTSTSFISKDSLNEKLINVTVIVSNAANVTAVIDGSIVYLTYEALESHDNSDTAHKSLRSWVQGLFDSLKLTWDSITGKPETFPPSTHTHDDKLDKLIEMPHNQSLNQDLQMGNYHFFNATGGLPSGYTSGDNDFVLQVFPSGVTNTGWQSQILHDMRSQNVFKRTKVDSSYGDWRNITDADTVDGKHASEFATASHNHDGTYFKVKQVYSGNIDELFTSGEYKVSPFNGTLPTGQTQSTANHSILVVHGDSTTGGTLVQELHTTNHTAYSAYANKHYVRIRFGGTWSAWKDVIDSGNADTVGGVSVDALAKYYRTNGSVDISDTNIKQFYGTCVQANSSAPSTDWWHIINVPHQDNNGYGAQLALGYHGNAGLQVRSASGTSWGGWYDVIGNIESLKSSVVNGKQSVANAINGKLGTSLSNQTSFGDMAYYINSIPMFKQENLVSTSSNYVYMQNCRAIAFARQGGSECVLEFANGVTSIGATVYRCAWGDGSFSSYRTTVNLTRSLTVSDITVGVIVFDSPVSFNVRTRASEGVMKIF